MKVYWLGFSSYAPSHPWLYVDEDKAAAAAEEYNAKYGPGSAWVEEVRVKE